MAHGQIGHQCFQPLGFFAFGIFLTSLQVRFTLGQDIDTASRKALPPSRPAPAKAFRHPRLQEAQDLGRLALRQLPTIPGQRRRLGIKFT